MNHKHFDDVEGSTQESPVSIPAESFFADKSGGHLWPDTLVKNPAFSDQIEKRKRLIQALQTIQSRVSDATLSLEEQVLAGKISEEHVADWFEALADLLTLTPEYGRIILYVPFEHVPGSDWKPGLERLRVQADRLRDAYMRTWKKLLGVHDVRANFVNGDVLETEKRNGDLPRVVKAAHFIPMLMQKGWLSPEDVLSMHDATGDSVLRESIEDTFGMLQERGLIDGHPAHAASKSTRNPVKPRGFTPESLRHQIEQRLKEALPMDDDATEKRRQWLAQNHRETVTGETGDEVSLSLEHHLIADEDIEQLIRADAHRPSQLAFVDGLRKAIERITTNDVSQGTALYARFQGRLQTLWEQKHHDTQPSLEKLFFRLHRLGIVDTATLDSLGLPVPSIDGTFSRNLRNLGTEMNDVQRVIDSIRSNPELSQYVYPVVLVYGSKLKGYGSKHADTDVGVFIRPTAPDDVKASIRNALQATMASAVLSDTVTEFWLEEDQDGLAVRDFESHDRSLGSSLWSHVLFGAAWSGDQSAMRELHARLLPTYFSGNEKTMFGRNARELYLEHLEQDLLQYRLMHKGYQRHYPAQGGLQSEQADRLDAESTFWDSGYRAIATKLFVEKVFLPLL